MTGVHAKAALGAVCALAGAAEIAAVALSWGREPYWDTLLYAGYSVALVVAGALIAVRYPRNAVGWLLCGTGLLNAVAADAAQGWALAGAVWSWPGVAAADLVWQSSWLPAGALAAATYLLFPDGHLLHRRWAVVVVLGMVGAVVGTLGWSLDPDAGREFRGGTNPFAVPQLPTDLMFGLGLAATGIAMVLAAGALGLRVRRARGAERRALAWFAAAAGCAAVVPPVVAALWIDVPALRLLTAVALMTVPVAAALVILRHRLYDIDAIVRRALLYATLSVLLGACYAGTALLLGVVVGRGSSWATAGATLVVAAAFRPLRTRVQCVLDRRLDPVRYGALERMRVFSEELRAGRTEPEDVVTAMREALAAPDLELRFVLSGAAAPDGADGRPVARADGRIRVPVSRGDTPVGEVLLAPRDDRPPALVAAVVRAGESAVEIARLRVELRRRLDEVIQSRRRLVTTAEQERRRIERDLHDGVQQRLVSIGLGLRHVQHEWAAGRLGDATGALDEAVAEIATTIAELRELAHGIRPGCLEDGLRPALADLADRARLPVTVQVCSRRFPPEVETAAYFTACEGLTNALKHAGASAVRLGANDVDGRLVVSVADDGVGGARILRGSGLAGLADRVAAHGGTLTVDSVVGAGTRLVAEFPCAS